MVYVEGPDNELTPRVNSETGKKEGYRDVFISNLVVAAEVIAEYCNKYDSEIRHYDGSVEHVPLRPGEKKYFFYKKSNGEEVLVDIHVYKDNGQQICLKQDLSYVTESGDKVVLGALIC